VSELKFFEIVATLMPWKLIEILEGLTTTPSICADSGQFASDIVDVFSTDFVKKGCSFVVHSPAVLAKVFNQPAAVMLAIIYSGFFQAEGCVVGKRASSASKHPTIDVTSASGACLFALMEHIKECFGVQTGSLLVSVPPEEEEDEGLEQDPKEEEEELDPIQRENEAEGSVPVSKRRVDLSEGEELGGIELLLEEETDREVVKALRKWKRVVKLGSLQRSNASEATNVSGKSEDSLKGEESGDGDESEAEGAAQWSYELVKGLAHKAAERFAYLFPETYRKVMESVIGKLQALYLDKAQSGRKVIYRLQYTARFDVLKLAPLIIMGTRWEKFVSRKLVAIAKWATSCKEVGTGKLSRFCQLLFF
jgi:hypothetical protein